MTTTLSTEIRPLSAAPFDAEADAYDATFTHTPLGRWLRAAVQARLAAAFPAGSRALELGCGTGEDAVWLARQGARVVATDPALRMTQVALCKARCAAVADRVSVCVLRAEDLGAAQGLFDGAYSNFGALNCVTDLRPVAEELARLVRPGGRLVLVLMGPWCPWEIGWYLLRGQPRTALRRLRRAGAEAWIGGQRLRVYYPTPKQVIAVFRPAFEPVGLAGVGALLPPSALSSLVDRWPRVFAGLADWERRYARHWPLTRFNDHYLLELERVGMATRD